MPSPPPSPKIILPILMGSLAVSVLLYIGLTYFVPVPQRPLPNPALGTALLSLAVLSLFVGIVAERMLLDRAQSPQEVMTAAIVSASLGEASAVFGLLVYFLSGQRLWTFFVLSLAYFARLFLRMPDFLSRMDDTSR